MGDAVIVLFLGLIWNELRSTRKALFGHTTDRDLHISCLARKVCPLLLIFLLPFFSDAAWRMKAAPAAGMDGQVQYNSNGSLSGSASLYFDDAFNKLVCARVETNSLKLSLFDIYAATNLTDASESNRLVSIGNDRNQGGYIELEGDAFLRLSSFATLSNDAMFWGSGAGYQSTGTYRTAIGAAAGYEASGDRWFGVGDSAGAWANGDHWTAVGKSSGWCATGSYWMAIGRYAGSFGNGDNWVAIGRYAGRNAESNTLYIDNRLADPGASHDPLTDAIVITEAGQVLLGRPDGGVTLRGTVDAGGITTNLNGLVIESGLITGTY